MPKLKPCPKCHERAALNPSFARDLDGYRTGAPVYLCGLCDHETPRKIYNTKKRRALALAFFSNALNIN
jgi:hypothetical protein